MNLYRSNSVSLSNGSAQFGFECTPAYLAEGHIRGAVPQVIPINIEKGYPAIYQSLSSLPQAASLNLECSVQSSANKGTSVFEPVYVISKSNCSTNLDSPLDLRISHQPRQVNDEQSTPICSVRSIYTSDETPLDLSRSQPELQDDRKTLSYHVASRCASSTPVSNQSPVDRFLSRQTAVTTDSDPDSQVSSSNSASVRSLIGNHPLDDILYLHCTRCQSSYGSVHGFRKHFRNAHGFSPSAEDVLIQSIKATKEFVAEQGRKAASQQPRLHCCSCGWQCDGCNRDAFSRHAAEHGQQMSSSRSKCFHCKVDVADAAYLRQHLFSHPEVYHFSCAYCSIAFKYEELIVQHMLHCHGMQPAVRKSISYSSLSSRVSSGSISTGFVDKPPRANTIGPLSGQTLPQDGLSSAKMRCNMAAVPILIRPNDAHTLPHMDLHGGIRKAYNDGVVVQSTGLSQVSAAQQSNHPRIGQSSQQPTNPLDNRWKTLQNEKTHILNFRAVLDHAVEQGIESSKADESRVQGRIVRDQGEHKVFVSDTENIPQMRNSTGRKLSASSLHYQRRSSSRKTIIQHIEDAVVRELNSGYRADEVPVDQGSRKRSSDDDVDCGSPTSNKLPRDCSLVSTQEAFHSAMFHWQNGVNPKAASDNISCSAAGSLV